MATTRTARKIIERAFSKAGIKTAETPLTASEIADGLDSLNDLLAVWGANGTLTGIDPIMNTSDALITPREADWALKANLGVVLAGEYGEQVNQVLLNEANVALAEFIKSRVDLRQLKFPSTLPKGAGNYGRNYEWDDDFFPADKKDNF